MQNGRRFLTLLFSLCAVLEGLDILIYAQIVVDYDCRGAWTKKIILNNYIES